MENKIAIFGGTFNPIHNAHLLLAEQVKEEFNIDTIIFIPSGIPPHKDNVNKNENIHRYNMVKEAILKNDNFEISDLELNRKGYSYTIDTLNHIKRIYPNHKIYFIIGADNVNEINTWKEPDKLFSLCEFIVAMRPGYNKKDIIEEISKIREKYGAKIIICNSIEFAVSSTIIRDKVFNSKSIRYLVPAEVDRYIKRERLYVKGE